MVNNRSTESWLDRLEKAAETTAKSITEIRSTLAEGSAKFDLQSAVRVPYTPFSMTLSPNSMTSFMCMQPTPSPLYSILCIVRNRSYSNRCSSVHARSCSQYSTSHLSSVGYTCCCESSSDTSRCPHLISSPMVCAVHSCAPVFVSPQPHTMSLSHFCGLSCVLWSCTLHCLGMDLMVRVASAA